MTRILICLGWLAVALLALYLRLQDLGGSPVHFDEATGARILGEELAGRDPAFNPAHFHGPWLHESSAPLARLRGENSWSSLSIETLRLNTVLAGWLLCATPLLWLRSIGPGGALTAGAFLASSPLLVYYSRIYIHESWLALFGMVAAASLYAFVRKPSHTRALAAGCAIGLMFATKETFAISIIAWGLAAAWILWKPDPGESRRPLKPYLLPGLSLAFAALFTSAYFYTDGFRNPAGYLDAFRTFVQYETSAGHDKPFFAHAYNLIWPKYQLGSWWSEGLIALIALVAFIAACARMGSTSAFRFLGISIIAHALIYSSIAYKTPWLMVLTWAQLCLLAGMLLTSLQRSSRRLSAAAGLVILLTLIWQFSQSRVATGRLANDSRNPYAYVPTSQNMESLPQWLRSLSDAHSLAPATVLGRDIWPLPWYIRGLEHVEYSRQIRPEYRDYPILFVMPEQMVATEALLSDSHQALPRSLRENVALIVYLRKDIWDDWVEREQP